MTFISDAAGLWLAKAMGAIVGSAISIAYLLPAGRREAAVRFAVGVVFGIVFGGAAGIKIATEMGVLGHLAPFELVLMGSAAASLCAWSAIGFVMRALDRRSATSSQK